MSQSLGNAGRAQGETTDRKQHLGRARKTAGLSTSTAARHMELIIRRLDSLSTLPAVAAQFLSRLCRPQLVPSQLAELIESDVALTAKIFSLAYEQGLTFAGENLSVRDVIDKLSSPIVHQALLTVKIFQAFDVDRGSAQRVLQRKNLALHSLAVACCTENIAEIAIGPEQKQLAFSAGLLHDIGKLALDEAMPKSFERIIEEAKARKSSLCDIERKHLGIDHTIIGKRLAEKWHFPKEIVFTIWLHHNDTKALTENIPGAEIALAVHLADLIAHQCQIGPFSGCDDYEMMSSLAKALSLSDEQINQITQKLPEQVNRRGEILGLEKSGGTTAAYCNLIHDTAAELVRRNTRLAEQNLELATRSTYLDFITDFFAGITADMSAVDIAGDFAGRWQKFYQTGPVVVFLVDRPQAKLLDAVVIDSTSGVNSLLLDAPANSSVIPAELKNQFAVRNVDESLGWLFEQIDVEFDLTKTKIVPLPAHGRVIGTIVFEHRYAAQIDKHLSKFNLVASIAGNIIALACAYREQQRLAEQFAQILARLSQAQQQLAAARSLAGIAETAAGAAHELNNPLAVISGRVQLLAKVETDTEKKQMLKQIQDRTEEISEIISDLLSFAKPRQGQPATVTAKSILEAAIQQTAEAHNLKRLEVEMQNIDNLEDIFVDYQQITLAIANVISNALQSYPGDNGPIKIAGGYDESTDSVKLEITDSGCGMDAETMQKATQPFFSAQEAGRRRGMGLAHTQRLVELNKGSLSIASKPGRGTTVTILLPRSV